MPGSVNGRPAPARPDLPEPARQNVQTVAQLEQQLHAECPWSERAGSAVADYFGSLAFVLAHLAFVAGWVVLNGGAVAGVAPFDPYPFSLLGLVIGVEFLVLTTFVLINQKRQVRRQESWVHLSLQLAILAEQEATKSMEMLQRVCRRLGVDQPGERREVQELVQSTSVESLAKEIEEARKE